MLVFAEIRDLYIGKNQKLCQNKNSNGETLPKLDIGIYSKYGQYYRYDITMYDFIHIIKFLIPILSWIPE